MPQLEIGLVDGGDLKLDQSLLKFNIKKKIMCKEFFKRTFSSFGFYKCTGKPKRVAFLETFKNPIY